MPATEHGRGNDHDGHDEHDATYVDGRLNRLDANIDAVVAVVPVVVRFRKAFRPQVNRLQRGTAGGATTTVTTNTTLGDWMPG